MSTTWRESVQRTIELQDTSCSVLLKSRKILCWKIMVSILGRLYLEIRKRHYINCCTLDSPTQTVPRAAARVSTLRSSDSYNRHILIWIIYQMNYFLFPKIWTSTKKGVSSCKTKITLCWECAVSNMFLFRVFKVTSSCSYFEHSTSGTSFLHQRLTHTPSQKVCDLSVLLAWQTS
jgi:hypothetical protein